MTALAVFAVYLAIDFVWALYTKHITANNGTTAGLLSAAVILLNGLGTISFTEDHWMLIPAAIGAFVGTWIVSCDWLRKLGQAVRRGRPSGDRAAPR